MKKFIVILIFLSLFLVGFIHRSGLSLREGNKIGGNAGGGSPPATPVWTFSDSNGWTFTDDNGWTWEDTTI